MQGVGSPGQSCDLRISGSTVVHTVGAQSIYFNWKYLPLFLETIIGNALSANFSYSIFIKAHHLDRGNRLRNMTQDVPQVCPVCAFSIFLAVLCRVTPTPHPHPKSSVFEPHVSCLDAKFKE